MFSVRNLLLIGFPYSGKSTLANTLSGTNDLEERESIPKPPKAEKFEKKEFKWKGMTYRAVDTIGVVTMPTKNQIAELIPEGISRVLFVVDGSSIAEELEKELEKFQILKKSFL